MTLGRNRFFIARQSPLMEHLNHQAFLPPIPVFTTIDRILTELLLFIQTSPPTTLTFDHIPPINPINHINHIPSPCPFQKFSARH
jgi:hypothetical protein